MSTYEDWAEDYLDRQREQAMAAADAAAEVLADRLERERYASSDGEL